MIEQRDGMRDTVRTRRAARSGTAVMLATLLGCAALIPLTVSTPAAAAPAAETAASSSAEAVTAAQAMTSGQRAVPERVILTPAAQSETSQSFSWRAADTGHTTGYVEIGRADAAATHLITAERAEPIRGQVQQHFSATVEGLVPATAYRYRVGLPGGWSDWAEFTTADPAATDLQFIAYGDAQVGLDRTWQHVVAQAEERAPDAVASVYTGDLIDTAYNDREWDNWVAGLGDSAARTSVIAAPGNQEFTGDARLSAWKAHFAYPENHPTIESIGAFSELAQGDTPVARQYAAYFGHWADLAAETVYATDYQNVRFIVLNASRDAAFLTPAKLPACVGEDCPSANLASVWIAYQAAWLDRMLEHSPATWNVVLFHQPVYSTAAGRNEPILREHWVPVLEEHDVDLVLMGHDHSYARGFRNDAATETTGLTTGPVYAVSNSGGTHSELESEARNVWTNNGATQAVRGEGVATYQVIDVTEDQLVYRSYVAERTPSAASWTIDPEATAAAATGRPDYVAQDVPAVGDVFDSFAITKHGNGAKWVSEPGVEIPAAPADPVIGTDADRAASAEPAQPAGFGMSAAALGETVHEEVAASPVAKGRTPSNDGFPPAGIVRAPEIIASIAFLVLGGAAAAIGARRRTIVRD